VPSRYDINQAAKCRLRLPLSIGLVCTAKSFWYIRYTSVVLASLYVLSTRGAVANKYPAGVNFTVSFGITMRTVAPSNFRYSNSACESGRRRRALKAWVVPSVASWHKSSRLRMVVPPRCPSKGGFPVKKRCLVPSNSAFCRPL
jgi:hypothetical protein